MLILRLAQDHAVPIGTSFVQSVLQVRPEPQTAPCVIVGIHPVK